MQLNILITLMAIFSGFVYFMALYYISKGLELVEVSKLAPIGYLSLVVIFILGVVIIKEPIFFTDILGSILIVSFQIYDAYNPIK